MEKPDWAELLYALFVLQDSKLVWIFSGNLGVTACLVTLLLWKRLKYVRAAHRSHGQADAASAPEAMDAFVVAQ